MHENQQQVPDWQRLGFKDKKAWSEAFVESVDWQEADNILFNLEIGNTTEAQNLVNLLVRDRKNGSGAAGTVLLKLESFGLIVSQFEAPLLPLDPLKLRELRKNIDTNLGVFKEEHTYREWEAVKKTLAVMNQDADAAINAIHFYQEQWDKGYSRSGAILTKLQALGIVTDLRDPQVRIPDQNLILQMENKINLFLNHQSKNAA